MKKHLVWLALTAGWLGFASISQAVEYIKICPQLNGIPLPSGFFYVPGTDMCFNPTNGEVLEPIDIGPKTITWRSMFPYPDGKWTTDPTQECKGGSLAKIGDFKSTDFTPDGNLKLRTPAFDLPLKSSEMITKVIMRGGFSDPRQPRRDGLPFATGGFCLRSIDATVLETQPSGPAINPPYGDNGLPIGCIGNIRIANMPGGYVIPATAAYPNIDTYFVNGDNKAPVAGPYVYGKKVAVTTDLGKYGLASLTYCNLDLGGCGGGAYNPDTQTFGPVGPGNVPLVGTLSVWACVEGQNGQAGAK